MLLANCATMLHELGISHSHTQWNEHVITEQGEVISIVMVTKLMHVFGKMKKWRVLTVLPPIPESVAATNRSQDDGIIKKLVIQKNMLLDMDYFMAYGSR